jgi:hypothetical protein
MFALEAGGRSSWWRASTLIADHFEKRRDGVKAALGFHLAVYSALGASFAFGLYALLHPSQVSSSSLAEYQVLPAAVVTNDVPQARGVAPSAAAVDPAPRTKTVLMAPPELALPPEPMPEPEVAPPTVLTPPPAAKPAAPPSQRRTHKKPSREVRIGTSNRRTACIPAYDSSGAQTKPCG